MDRLSSDKVWEYVKDRKDFTTSEIQTRFRARKQQAAGAIAILRIKGVVIPASPSKREGISVWTTSKPKTKSRAARS